MSDPTLDRNKPLAQLGDDYRRQRSTDEVVERLRHGCATSDEARVEIEHLRQRVANQDELLREMAEALEQYVIEEGATGSAEKAFAKYKDMTK